MEADAPADIPTDDHNELARAVALLERVSGASVEEARQMRRARAEGSVEEIVESARDRAARILSAVGPSVDRATEAEVPATEEAFSDFSKELIRVRESVGAARDSVVDLLVLPGAGPQVSTPVDLRPAVSFPIEPPSRAPRDEPVSAAAAYFAALRTLPAPEPETVEPEIAEPEIAEPEIAEPETAEVEIAEAVATADVAADDVDEVVSAPEEAALEEPAAEAQAPARPRYEIPWFLNPPPPRPGVPEATAAEDTATVEAGTVDAERADIGSTEVPAPEAPAAEPAVEAPRTSRYEIPWFLNPPPPRPTAATAPTEIVPAAADPTGDLLPSAKTTTPKAAPAPIVPAPVVTPLVEAAEPAPAPAPAELMPAAKAGSKLRIRRILARLFRDAGILLIAFAVLQLWGTGLLQSRSQHELRADFAQAVASAHAQRARAAALVVAGKHTTVRQVIPRAPSTGDPIARIRIPAIGVDQIVVEGTGVSELRRGPGHDESTPLPGGVGDSVITGHRTTYGAPFNHLDDLKVGDRISVTTTEGAATYEVSDGPKTVSGGVVAPVAGTNHLILTTSQPRYKASGQLAVVARLRNPASPAASTVADRGGSATVGSFGWFASSLWGSVLLWGALLLVVYFAMYRLATRWRSSRIVIFTLMAVPLVITAFLFLQAVGRVFPADY